MRRTIAAAFILNAAAITATHAADLEIKRVLLSQGGVAYYELSGSRGRDGTLTFSVPRNQVDDVLKSLVVLDGATTVQSVRLPGEAPLSLAFGGLPLDEGAFQSLPDLLRALRGQTVSLAAGKTIKGRIVAVDHVVGDDSGAVTLMTDGTLQRVALADVQSVTPDDPALRDALAKALDAFAEAQGEGTRKLTLALRGGSGNATVAYVAAAPLWKSAYRLTFNGGKGSLQGWAVLENYSGQDWNNVQLTLASGNPATFRQALYRAYFVDRPELPVELYDRILPPQDKGAMMEAAVSDALSYESARQVMSAAPVPGSAFKARSVSAAQLPTVQESAVSLTFDLGNVTLANGQTLSLPITEGELPASLVTYLALEDNRPFAAMEIKNTGKNTLPPGIVTLYDADGGSLEFLGDARLGAVPAGEERLLAFAGDTKVKADRKQTSSRRVSAVKVVDGVLTATESITHTLAADVSLPKGETRRVVVDFYAPDRWRVQSPKEDVRRIENGYRVGKSLSASGTVSLVMTEDVSRTVALVSSDVSELNAFVSGGSLSAETEVTLKEVIARKQKLTAAQRQLTQAEKDLETARKDEERARENLKAVGENAATRQRYMDRLSTEEARVDALTKTRDTHAAAVRAAEAELRQYVQGIRIE